MKTAKFNQCSHESRADIPWLLNGTLSDSAAAVLRKHLESCNDCRADLESHKTMRSAVLGNDVTPMKPATRAEDVIGIAASSRPQVVRNRNSRLQALAASVAILALAIGVMFFLGEDDAATNQLFETATSQGASGGIDYVMQLRFDDGVSSSEKVIIVAQLKGVVKWAVSESGYYEVHVQLPAPSMTVLEDYEESTSAISGVLSAEFTALQLPVR